MVFRLREEVDPVEGMRPSEGAEDREGHHDVAHMAVQAQDPDGAAWGGWGV
jgi:hypothetical protein